MYNFVSKISSSVFFIVVLKCFTKKMSVKWQQYISKKIFLTRTIELTKGYILVCILMYS